MVRARCAEIQKKYPVLGNVRGLGAMLGLEFVKDPATKEPNGELVTALVQECAKRGLMIENAGRWAKWSASWLPSPSPTSSSTAA